MNKKIKNIFLLIFLIILILLVLNEIISIPCIIHEITNLYCPGCGATRMVKSILKLDFYQAFRYNQLLFIMSPFIVFFTVENFYSIIKKKKALYKKVPEYVWYFVIILLVVYAIIRNIYPYFAPTKI